MDGNEQTKRRRRVWRLTADAPLGEFVEVDPTPPPGTSDETLLSPRESTDWRSSSWDLLNGLDVRDHSDSIPDALLDKLFKR